MRRPEKIVNEVIVKIQECGLGMRRKTVELEVKTQSQEVVFGLKKKGISFTDMNSARGWFRPLISGVFSTS